MALAYPNLPRFSEHPPKDVHPLVTAVWCLPKHALVHASTATHYLPKRSTSAPPLVWFSDQIKSSRVLLLVAPTTNFHVEVAKGWVVPGLSGTRLCSRCGRRSRLKSPVSSSVPLMAPASQPFDPTNSIRQRTSGALNERTPCYKSLSMRAEARSPLPGVVAHVRQTISLSSRDRNAAKDEWWRCDAALACPMLVEASVQLRQGAERALAHPQSTKFGAVD